MLPGTLGARSSRRTREELYSFSASMSVGLLRGPATYGTADLQGTTVLCDNKLLL